LRFGRTYGSSEREHCAPCSRPGGHSWTFAMRTLVAIVMAALLASCGRAPEPVFVNQSGDLATFLVNAISNQAPLLVVSNSLPVIKTAWRSRVNPGKCLIGAVAQDCEALQVQTAPTNFASLEVLITRSLGTPTQPLNYLIDGWRHVGWSRSGLDVWLLEDGSICRVEIVTKK
jgi:hypothetical protein